MGLYFKRAVVVIYYLFDGCRFYGQLYLLFVGLEKHESVEVGRGRPAGLNCLNAP